MKRLMQKFYLAIAAFMLGIFNIHTALAQTTDNIYICGKDFCQPIATSGISRLSFREDYLYLDGRRYPNGSIDSITFIKPNSSYLDALGQEESVSNTDNVTLLDITKRNSEDESKLRNVYSAWYMLTVAGVPFSTSDDLESSLKTSKMIVVSSPITSNTFSDKELQDISSWISDGGTLIISAAVNPDNNSTLQNIVGYDRTKDFSQKKVVTWNKNLTYKPEFDYIDTEEENSIIIGNNEKIRSYHFNGVHTDVDTLATTTYGTNIWAIAVRHHLGNGYVYSYGFPWGLLIQSVQTGKDSYKRTNNNHFEPSADVVPLQLRCIYCHQRSTPSVWKFTIPAGYESILIPTHDCDSKTALDSMYYMSDYEKSIGAQCHYFITTHYFREPQVDDDIRQGFSYTQERVPKVRALVANGHTVGSHSVGHFPDFSILERFPMTVYNDTSEYHPMYDNVTEKTTGGSTWAEINLSKKILSHDLNKDVQSFRTGHLCMNDSIPSSEKMAGIKFASCYTAHDMRSEFPFQERLGNTFEGEFNGVLEMPLHFSDVYNSSDDTKMNENNWKDKVENWKDIHTKLTANYAPAIILIHPNRKWKMEAEKMLVDSYDRDKIGVYNFEAYGNFWNVRANTNFAYSYDADKNIITIHLLNKLDDYSMLPFEIENINDDNIPTIHLTDPDNKIVEIGQLKKTEANGRYICVF